MLTSALSSVLNWLLFIIVKSEFRTGCPWELLYADNLMISAEPMEKLLIKLKTWRHKRWRRDLERISVVSVRHKLVAIQSSVVACTKNTRNAVGIRALTLTSGAPDDWGTARPID